MVDGDTLKVRRGSGSATATVTVRVLGIDTPETHDPRKPVQCYGPQAAARAVSLLTGRTVWLAGDPSQDRHDKYGRELDYIWLSATTSYDWLMVHDGFAHEYTYRTPYRYQRLFRLAQADAHGASRGFWSPATCGGDTLRPARSPP
ncbi:MAG: thermonuclease family protein [Mycobacteriales bacterium]